MIPDSGMITTMFFILVPFLKRAPYIIIHLARNAERREEAYWCQSYFQNLNHSSVCPFPDSVSGFRFRIPGSGLLLFHTPRKWIDVGGAEYSSLSIMGWLKLLIQIPSNIESRG